MEVDPTSDDQRRLQDRWRDGEFAASVGRTLTEVFVGKTAGSGVDLRGIAIGLDGALPELLTADLQAVHLRDVDLSFARLSCSMVRGSFDACLFHEAYLDTCRMASAQFVECRFDGATLNSPWMDDAALERCSFADANVSGRGVQEYGGKRTLFVDCDFTGATLKNLTFRACRFTNCRFEGTTFVRCSLVGVRFEKGHPPRSALEGCDLQRVTVEGQALE